MRRARVTYSVVHLFNIFILVAPYTVRRVLPVSADGFTVPKNLMIEQTNNFSLSEFIRSPRTAESTQKKE